MLDDIENMEKPVISMVNGILRRWWRGNCNCERFGIASASASFVLTENNIGVIPASGKASRMIQMIGIGRLKEMMMTAPMDANG